MGASRPPSRTSQIALSWRSQRQPTWASPGRMLRGLHGRPRPNFVAQRCSFWDFSLKLPEKSGSFSREVRYEVRIRVPFLLFFPQKKCKRALLEDPQKSTHPSWLAVSRASHPLTSDRVDGQGKVARNFLFNTKMVFPKSVKSRRDPDQLATLNGAKESAKYGKLRCNWNPQRKH